MSTGILALTAVFGFLTTCLSLCLCIYFFQYRNNLSRAFAWMLGGEAVMGAVTVAFATAALLSSDGIPTNLSPLMQTIMRWTAFLATSATTIHLAKTIKNISK